MSEYIDVRGAYPIYFNGFKSIRLPENTRNWTIEQARAYYLAHNKGEYFIIK